MRDGRTRSGKSFTDAVAERFGLLPNFFCSAPVAAGLIDELWAFTKSAYLDSPLPSLFKERLFVHLSRFCEVRYCIVRHVGFLLGEGRPAGDCAATPHTLAQTLALLRRPVPDATMLDYAFGRLEAHPQPSELPPPETQAEADLFDALTVMFLVPQQSARARSGLRKAVGNQRFELLVAFLAFVRTAHYWTEMHPELAYEPDMCAVMERQPELAHLLLATGEAEAARGNAELRQTIDDLHRAKGSLRESDARLRAVIAGIPQLVWRAISGGEWIWASPQWTEYTGLSEESSVGFGWLDAVHPDDREKVVLRWAEAERLGAFDVGCRLYDVAEHRYRWFRTRARPMRDERGHVVEWLGTSTDVHDLRQMQERQEVLLAELQHRTRNLLAVVHSITSQTIRTSETLMDFEINFSHRLAALSRVQCLLARSDDEPITMHALLGLELEALGAAERSGRIAVQGPEVRLRKATAQTFALALHELATNAAKYGALATHRGHLRVTWRTYTDETVLRLALDWQENWLDRRREEQSPTTILGGYGTRADRKGATLRPPGAHDLRPRRDRTALHHRSAARGDYCEVLTTMRGPKLLTGRRVLLVEDDYFIAEELRRDFAKTGAEILGPVGRLDEALALIDKSAHIDGAVLDIKLHDEMVYPVADALLERGVPFVFTTGYEKTVIPAPYANVRRCEKPFTPEIVAEALFG